MGRSDQAKKNRSRKGKATPRPADAPPPTWQRRLGQEMGALLLLGLALFCLLALGSHSLYDPQWLAEVWSSTRFHNWGGKAGALLSGYFLLNLGLGGLWIPLLLLGLAWQSHRHGLEALSVGQVAAGLWLLVASSGLAAFCWPFVFWGGDSMPGGGRWGMFIAGVLQSYLNPRGAFLALVLLLLLSFMGATRISYVGLISLLGQGVKGAWALIWRRGKEAAPPYHPRRAAPARPLITKNGGDTEEPGLSAPPPPEAAPRARRAAPAPGKFIRPALDLLDAPPPWDYQVQEGAMLAQAQKMEDTLRHFGVEGRVTAIMSGPVVSRFELEPAPGVKISKVTGLADDLALALKALSVRIVAPVPGKAVIGIEIPNPKRQVVALREILADNTYQKSTSRLTLALGKDIMGQPVVTDLAKMPHLLIAGATGSGKSVGLNAMLLSILFKAAPEEVRVLLIDPKRIELSTYEGIPHLLHPVVVSAKEATAALHWAVAEMERRYELLGELGVRHIEGYNQKAKAGRKAEAAAADADLPRVLPYVVLVIDELADLMLVSSRDTEEYLIRLAQKARASGVHLLVATQRPSVDVITGLIKANFPTRIAYQVSSRADSRVILDTMGAERLLGQGDLLFLPPGTSRLKRIHGAYVSEEEVARVVEFLKAQAAPEYEPGLLELKEREEAEEDLGEKDEKWEEALALVAETRNASISMLQRRLRVGYNRAARIIETMEKQGLVGPSDGLKPREVYIPRR